MIFGYFLLFCEYDFETMCRRSWEHSADQMREEIALFNVERSKRLSVEALHGGGGGRVDCCAVRYIGD